ncbi:MAG: hypothetical protein ACJ0UT_00015 [Candidatus Latescibacterota bacterium]
MSTAHQQAVLNNYRLAYQQEVIVNWCPGLGTVLSNEEVTNEGRSERGDFPVYRKPLKQWIMRITSYAPRLLDDLDATLEDRNGEPPPPPPPFSLDWPDPIKLMQRNWIGQSFGAEVLFEVFDPETGDVAGRIPVFTTRPDTLFGATFMAIAPQHPLLTQKSQPISYPINGLHIQSPSGKGTRTAEISVTLSTAISPKPLSNPQQILRGKIKRRLECLAEFTRVIR